MVMPRPVPSMFLCFPSSIRRYSSKSFGRSSCFMPMPVSSTSTCRWMFSPSRTPFTLNHTFPLSVYLTALERRLVITCLILTLSPYSIFGRFESISASSFRSLLWACCSVILIRSETSVFVSYSEGMISILPDSIFEESRMSLIIEISTLPAS